MLVEYKLDIAGKVITFYAVFYFVFGLFTTYALGCTYLDKVSERHDVLSFWMPIAVVNSLLNLINFSAIIFCLHRNKKYVNDCYLINGESSTIFRIICTPLFFLSVVYLCWRSIDYCLSHDVLGVILVVVTVCELLIFSGTVSMMSVLTKSNSNYENTLDNQIKTSVLLITLIGIVNYFIFHISGQQVHRFIMSASQFANFSHMYNSSIETSSSIQDYGSSIVIMFCACCIAYIIPLLYAVNQEMAQEENVTGNEAMIPSSEDLQLSTDNTEESQVASKSSGSKSWHLDIPPLSLLIGIIFITIVVIMLVIVIGLTNESSSMKLKKVGQKIITIFPSPIYLLSIPILYVQIKAMESWPRTYNNKNMIDKCLLWIGAAGLLIASMAEIKIHTYIFKDYSSAAIVVLYILLLIHALFQAVTIALALDRKWNAPKIESLHSYICPTFAMFSINLALLFIAIYYCRMENSVTKIEMENEKRLFVKIFNEGFHSIAVTLMIIVRLHSALVFGKMTLSI